MQRIRSELHFHLLPGVDDGPDDLDEALDLARMAVADGTAAVVCTPHVHHVDVATIPDRVRELQAGLDAALIPLGLRAGGEISPGTFLTDAELATIAQGPAGRRWVLLEGPIAGATLEEFDATADEIIRRGYGLVIAHPERSPDLVAPNGGLGRRLLHGAQIQVNASSISGFHGERARSAGLDLVKRGLVTALASDAHGADRPPRLTEAVDLLGAAHAGLADVGPTQLLRFGIEPARRAA